MESICALPERVSLRIFEAVPLSRSELFFTFKECVAQDKTRNVSRKIKNLALLIIDNVLSDFILNTFNIFTIFKELDRLLIHFQSLVSIPHL